MSGLRQSKGEEMNKASRAPRIARTARRKTQAMNGGQAKEMSLRDYFAAKVMLGLVTEAGRVISVGKAIENKIAVAAYRIADAMLAERNKP